MIAINYKPAERQLRTFTRLWFPLFVAALGGMFWWRANAPELASMVWGLGAVLSMAMVASAPLARFVFVALMWVTYPLGLALSYTTLAIIFFLVFTPIGLGMRLFRRDPLALRARGRASHWIACEQDDSAERAFRQF